MSGSLVLRSGVGTQMLTVSSSAITWKSVVARSLPWLTSGSQDFGRNVPNIGIARVDTGDLSLVHVDPGDGESRLGELHRQGQADVAQPDHADPGRVRPNPALQFQSDSLTQDRTPPGP